MKKFKEPELEVDKFKVEDVLTVSTEDDEGAFQPFSSDPLGKLVND